MDLTRERTRYWQRLANLLEDGLIKVSAVASTLDTKSVRDMLKALIGVYRDPRRLAGLVRGRMKAKYGALIEAPAGRFHREQQPDSAGWRRRASSPLGFPVSWAETGGHDWDERGRGPLCESGRRSRGDAPGQGRYSAGGPRACRSARCAATPVGGTMRVRSGRPPRVVMSRTRVDWSWSAVVGRFRAWDRPDCAQPIWLCGPDGETGRLHLPDLLLESAGGSFTLVDVKPAEFAKLDEVARVFAWTERVCASRGWPCEVWSGEDPSRSRRTLTGGVRTRRGLRVRRPGRLSGRRWKDRG